MMSYAYIRGALVVHVAGVDSEPVDGTRVVVIPDGATVEVGYNYDGATFSAPAAIAAVTEILPIELKLRFTSAERVAIRAKRATDAAIDDFMQILDDPRLTVVQLNIAPTIEAVTYIINAIKTVIPYTQADADARIAQILS